MTAAGKQKLMSELEYLISVKRKEVVARIKVARCFGVLSDNPDYDTAKEDQAFVEGRILTLETMIQNAIVIEEDEQNNNIVALGKTVSFIEIPNGEEESYTIVGSAEADPLEGLISNDSPIAKSIIGRGVGEQVKVVTPGGDMDVQIVSIN